MASETVREKLRVWNLCSSHVCCRVSQKQLDLMRKGHPGLIFTSASALLPQYQGCQVIRHGSYYASSSILHLATSLGVGGSEPPRLWKFYFLSITHYKTSHMLGKPFTSCLADYRTSSDFLSSVLRNDLVCGFLQVGR